MRKFRPFLFPALLFVAVFLAYANVYPFNFLYDDEFLIQKNRFLDSWSFFFEIFRNSSTGGAGFTDSFYRPLQGVAYLVMTQLFDRDTWVYHLLNVGLHAANALLIFALGRRLRFPPAAALLGASLWALHPLHTEAITYMSGTADPLGVFFLLSAVVWMVPRFTRASLIGGCALFAGALLSKESTIVLPALLVVMIFRLEEKPLRWRAYLKTLPFWLVAFVYLGLRQGPLNFNQDFSMYKQANAYTESFLVRVWTFLGTLPHYVELLVWPHDLHIDRGFDFVTDPLRWDVFVGGLIVLGGIALCVRALHRSPQERGAAWAFLWFMAAYFPCSGLLVPVNSLFLEHWMYLPIIGLCLQLGRFPFALDGVLSRRLVGGALAAVSLAFAIVTFQQNTMWKDAITLYTTILRYSPAIARVHHNLAMAYSDRGEDDKALAEYKFILEHGGHFPQTYHNVGRLLLRKQDFAGAEASLRESLRLDPRFYPSYEVLEMLYRAQGETAKADEAATKLAELRH